MSRTTDNPQAPPTTLHPAPKRGVLGIRFRLLLLILVMQTVMVWWVSDSEIARGIYLICYSLMMPTALYLLLARALRRWLPLEDHELLLGYIVLTATIPIIGFGGLRFLATGMGFLQYFSETQPAWLRYLPVLKDLPVLHDRAAITPLYLGEAGVPWRAWITPIAFWSIYLLLLGGLWLCLAGMLRRVWIQHERLTFPVAMLPLQLVDPKNDIFRRGLFWLGFALPTVLQSLMALNYWYPVVPAMQMKAFNAVPLLFRSPPWNAIPDFQIGFYPMATGLAYFVPGSVSFSCWFLTVVMKLLFVVGAAFGIEGVGTVGRFPYTQEQGVGAWIAFAGLLLWLGARQWRGVLHTVAAQERRLVAGLAVVSLILALLAVLMMAATGISLTMAGGILLVYAAYVLTGARVRAEAGAQWTFSPLITPFRMTHAALGSPAMSDKALVAGTNFDHLHVDIRAQSLPYLMEGLAISDRLGIPTRTVMAWVGLGLVTALGLGWWRTLSDLYAVGAAAAQANQYPLVKVQINFNQMSQMALLSGRWQTSGLLAMAAGGGITLFLAWARRIGFGLHPIGYVVCNTITMNAFIVPFFLAWAAKTIILRLGGDRAYRRSVPFFVGVILGDIVTQATWALAGWVFDVPIYQFLT